MTGRTGKSAETIQSLRTIFKEHHLEIVQNGKVVSRKNNIWIDLSEKLNYGFTPGALYTIAAKNYYDIHFELGLTKLLPKITDEWNDDQGLCSDNEISDHSDSDSSAEKRTMFSVVLSRQEFSELLLH